MDDPIPEIYDSTDSTEYNETTPIPTGSVDPGTESTPLTLDIWNNKGGSSDVMTMADLRVTIVDSDGNRTGRNYIDDHYFQIKSITDDDASFTPIGGAVTKLLSDLRGSKLTAPGQPTGTPAEGTGSVGAGTYYYSVSAVDETGETLKGTESAAVVVSGANNQVNLSWTAVGGATGYKIYRTTSTGVYGSSSLLATVETNSYTDKLASTSTGQPLVSATVTYQHKHVVQLKFVPPSDYVPDEDEDGNTLALDPVLDILSRKE